MDAVVGGFVADAFAELEERLELLVGYGVCVEEEEEEEESGEGESESWMMMTHLAPENLEVHNCTGNPRIWKLRGERERETVCVCEERG